MEMNASKQHNLFKLAFKLYIASLVIFISYYYMQPHQMFNNIKQINRKTTAHLKQLVKTKFFRIIRINLENDCPFWAQQKICSSGSCNVCRCDQKDIPFIWSKTDEIISNTKGLEYWSNERQQKSSKWIWHVQDEQNDEGEYFDVNQNKQAFTNYNGTFIWSLIYKQNCFSGVYDKMCKQQKILYKIISGLHASISTHLSYFYKDIPKQIQLNLPKDLIKKQQKYYFNKDLYLQRVLNHPQRIENLYFLYSILLKAVDKIKTPLLEYQISSDNVADDLNAKNLIRNFIQNISNYSDELKLDSFFYQESSIVKSYQKYVHNISKIMDCVECQKCRLFGKMQTYGLGTAMKIIFGYENLKRNQLVALLNTLNKISMSVQIHLNNSKSQKEIVKFYLKLYFAVGISLIIFFYIAILAFQNVVDKMNKQLKNVAVKVE